jgi:hypothetical protein
MDTEVKDRWIDALESGDYEQGRSVLATVADDGKRKYCCLGVLCEVLGIPGVKAGSHLSILYDGADIVLPDSAVSAAALEAVNPVIVVDDNDWAFVLAGIPDDEKRCAADRDRDIEWGSAGNHGHVPAGSVTLSLLNDCEVPFRMIAQLIRKYL